MKTTTMDKYIIHTGVFDRKNLTIVENKETGHWIIGDLLSIGLVFRSSTSQKSLNLNYDSDFNPLESSLYFDPNRGQFYIKTINGDQYIKNEKYIEMMKEFNSNKREDK